MLHLSRRHALSRTWLACRRAAGALALLLALGPAPRIAADQTTPPAEQIVIAISAPLSGDGQHFGKPIAEGAQLAIEEYNATGTGPTIQAVLYDDQGLDDRARALAVQVGQTDAVAVIGPAFSTNTMAAAPPYGDAGLAMLPPTATSDAITQNPNTYRVVFKNSEQGEVIANYLARVLGIKSALVIAVENTYGLSLLDGFNRTAIRLGIEADVLRYASPDDIDALVAQVAARAQGRAVVLAVLDSDGAPLMLGLRRAGVQGPFLGGDTFGDEAFARRFVREAEEVNAPGFFTQNLYGLAPTMLDSANAETLAFADRYRTRFGYDASWTAVAGYDAAKVLAAGVARLARAGALPADTAGRRQAIRDFLGSLNAPDRALNGLIGPMFFDAERGRQQSIRVGRFVQGRFESAPLQFVRVAKPSATDMASGAVFELNPGRWARLQRVVYTGIFINEITHVDLQRVNFGADFYVWLRYAKDAGPGSADPSEIVFPNQQSGRFDKSAPAKTSTTQDGMEYRLWRVQGEFRNDYDLRAFPFDRQTLQLPFFNARADADQIVYVVDRSLTRTDAAAQGDRPGPTGDAPAGLAVAAASAFRELTQWKPVHVEERRENLVTESALGDPISASATSYRELSGFLAQVELERRTLATLTKNLLPLGLLTLIMFASLYFPHGLVKEKVTVAITGALSGAVLLTAINSQLGGVGYTLRIEYVFYVFFALCLLCIASVLLAERLRVAGRTPAALRTEQGTRILFAASVAAVALAAVLV